MTYSDPPRWAARIAPPEGAGPRPGTGTLWLALSGSVAPADVAALCGAVADLIAGSRASLVVCDVGALADPGLAAVDALARIQLMAARLGRRVRFCRVPQALLELVVLAGLDEVLPQVISSECPGETSP